MHVDSRLDPGDLAQPAPDGIPMSNFHSVNRGMYSTYTSTILKSAPNSASQLLAPTIAHYRKKGRDHLG